MCALRVDILWTGKILYCCKLTLFTSPDKPHVILYELEDKLDSFERDDCDLYLLNFKPVHETGSVLLRARGRENIGEAVEMLITKLKGYYAERTATLYHQEITHEPRH